MLSILYLFIIALLPLYLYAEPVKIMPLGNSITQGGEVHPSYRYALWKKLIDAEIDFEFVGSQDLNWNNDTKGEEDSPKAGEVYKGKTFNNIHEGHWGWTSEQILNGNPDQPNKHNLEHWLKKHKPDVVLLHLGTNDMFKGEILDEAALNRTLDNLREIVIQIRAASPGVTVFMAQLIPIDYGNGNANRNVSNLNARIPDLAQELNTEQSPVVVVDQNSGFDATLGQDTYDGLHPNASGEEKMAQRWFEAILSETIIPLPVELTSFKGMATATGTRLLWTTASEQDNHYFEVQRSQDPKSFETIGRVEGAGTTSIAKNYTFEDEEAPAGTNYYRLRQVDFDGTESYSAIVAVSLARGESEDMRLYPTRTQGQAVTLQMRALQPNEKFIVGIYTLEGKLVKSFEGSANSQGNYSSTISPADLKEASIYMVRATLGNRVFLRHLLVDL